MREYKAMTKAELESEYSSLLAQFDESKSLGLKLNMARGKPSKLQLDAVSDILKVIVEPPKKFQCLIDFLSIFFLADIALTRGIALVNMIIQTWPF